MKIRFKIVAMLITVIMMASCNNSKSSKPEDSQTTTEESEESQPAAAETAAVDLPNLPLTKTDGTQLMANGLQGKTILFFFQPDCDHCQRETVQMRENLAAFRDYKVYFITNAAMPELSKFAQEYKIAFEPNFVFAHATLEDILNTVGPMESPSLFIYSDKGQLVKVFKGETPIEQILPAL
jgi:cytochrome oxidase Cu insertion factor (SCO1/SenC/PrrC family)